VSIDQQNRQVEEIYIREFNQLVRLRVLLVGETGLAEGLVQDAFVGMYARMDRSSDRSSTTAPGRSLTERATRIELA
jgi:DNA-directed RNA polymerase specialized sigma24 family protein